MIEVLTYVAIRIRSAIPSASDERGEVTEKVLITAAFAAIAIAAAAVIGAKIIAKANSIPTD